MSNRIVQGVTYVPSQRCAAIIDEASSTFELPSNGNVTEVMASVDCTVRLPAQPRVAETIRISANGGDVTVNGNGHTIAGGVSTVDDDSFRDFAFSKAGSEWVPAATGSASGGPSLPNRSFQFDNSGSFGGSTFFFEVTPDQIFASEDESAFVQHDSTEDRDVYVYQHFYTPTDDPTFPPGVSLGIGTNSVGDLDSIPAVLYDATLFWNWTYCDNVDGTNASHIVFGLGAQPNGLAAPLNVSGNYFYPNTMLSGTFIDPADDLFGGGQGVEFIGRAAVEPTSGPSTEAGIIRFVALRGGDAVPLPFGQTSTADSLNLAAVTSLLFGAAAVGDTEDDAYLPFGFAANAVALAAAPWVNFPSSGYLVGMSVRQNGHTGTTGTLDYTVMTKDGNSAPVATTITVNLAANAREGSDVDYANMTFVDADQAVSVLIEKNGINATPTNVAVMVYFIPCQLGA